jgi:hypothetical protein
LKNPRKLDFLEKLSFWQILSVHIGTAARVFKHLKIFLGDRVRYVCNQRRTETFKKNCKNLSDFLVNKVIAGSAVVKKFRIQIHNTGVGDPEPDPDRMFLALPDPEPLQRGIRIQLQIIKKNIKKNLHSSGFVSSL